MARQIGVAISDEDYDRLLKAIKGTQLTVYSFAKDAIVKELRERENLSMGPQAFVSGKLQELVDALVGRKWRLYMTDDYSDNNHREWLAGRFPRATKQEIIEAVAYFRTLPNNKKA